MPPAVITGEEPEATATSTTEDTAPIHEGSGSDAEFTDDLQRLVGGLLASEADDEDEDGGASDVDDEAEGDAEGEGEAEGDGEEGEPAGEEEQPAEGDAPATEGEAEKPADEAAPAPKWEGLTVRVGKVDPSDPEAVAIPDAQITKSGGFVHVAVPEAGWARFEQRLSRGYHAERRWRQIETAQREIEARKEQPPRKSDREIEAELSMELLEKVLGEDFGQVLDPEQYENLKLRVEIAQRAEADRYAAEEKSRVAAASEPGWEDQQATGIATQINTLLSSADVIAANPEIQNLTKEEVQEVFRGLLPYARSLYYKEGADIYADTRLMLAALKQRAANKQSATSPVASTSAPTTSPVKTDSSSTTASSSPSKTPAARAERLNRGADAAARTTSVKANRGTRPANATTRRSATNGKPEPVVDPHVKAVDDYSRLSRSYLSSPGFDLPDFEDEG